MQYPMILLALTGTLVLAGCDSPALISLDPAAIDRSGGRLRRELWLGTWQSQAWEATSASSGTAMATPTPSPISVTALRESFDARLFQAGPASAPGPLPAGLGRLSDSRPRSGSGSWPTNEKPSLDLSGLRVAPAAGRAGTAEPGARQQQDAAHGAGRHAARLSWRSTPPMTGRYGEVEDWQRLAVGRRRDARMRQSWRFLVS
jgi:hypothetical protein